MNKEIECPAYKLETGDKCDYYGTCCWGEETCCGETYDSYCCGCGSGDARCYTNSCDELLCPDTTETTDTSAPTYEFCGGIAGFTCEDGYVCVDDPSDDCDPYDPKRPGADCGGICIEEQCCDPDLVEKVTNSGAL